MSTAVSVDLEFDGDVILCAATCWTNGFLFLPQVWCSHGPTGLVALTPNSVAALLDSLWEFHAAGVTLVTWGGTGCDWPKLRKAADASYHDKVRQMALASVDIPLISVAANGMMMGLSATAVGMGFGFRPSCDSELVPSMWNSKDAVKQHEVVQHVQWDAWVTVQIYNRLMFQVNFARPQITWVTQRSGPRSVRLQRERLPSGDWGLPNVACVLTWEEPVARFQIPEHLHPSKLTAWLREPLAPN